MKKTLLIAATVGGYSLLETGMLFSALTHPFGDWSAQRRFIVFILAAQAFFFIPGIAVLLSRITYGNSRLLQSALSILLVGLLPLPMLVALIFTLGALIDPSMLFDAGLSVTSDAVLRALALLLLVGIVIAIFFAVRTAIRRGVVLETRRWLSDLDSGCGVERRNGRNRGLRIAVCIPFITVLLVFLFLPETWGILSHLAQPRAGSLAGYQLSIPFTWVIDGRSSEEGGGSSVSGLAGRGMAMGVAPYLRADLPLGGWSVGTEPYRQPDSFAGNHSSHILRSDEDQVVATRNFFVGKDRLTCEEYSPAYVRRAHFVYDSSLVFVRCDGSSRLYASMVGKRDFVSDFYKMIERIAETN